MPEEKNTQTRKVAEEYVKNYYKDEWAVGKKDGIGYDILFINKKTSEKRRVEIKGHAHPGFKMPDLFGTEVDLNTKHGLVADYICLVSNTSGKVREFYEIPRSALIARDFEQKIGYRFKPGAERLRQIDDKDLVKIITRFFTA